MSSMRIVLVDHVGGVLFSGASLSVGDPDVSARDSSVPTVPEAEVPDAEAEAEIEACPETLRSADSGVFPSVRPAKTRRAPVAVEDLGAQTAAGIKRDPRAA